VADIFISYKSNERDAVRAIAEGLRAAGFTVWWDHSLIGGDDYSEVIQREIAAAKVVMPIWSKQSIKSQWVRAEADEGAGKLLPVRIDDVRPPLPHNKLHTIDLVSWSGDEQDPRWRRLIEDVGAILGGAAPAPTAIAPAPQRWRARPAALLAAAAAVVLIAAAVFIARPQPTPIPDTMPPSDRAEAPPSVSPPALRDETTALTALRQGASAARVSLCRSAADTACDIDAVTIGETVHIEIMSPVTGRLILIDQAANGVQTQIFPNGLTPASADVLLAAGEAVRLPLPVHGFEFIAAEPAGSSRLIALIVPAERALAPVIEENRRTRGIAVVPAARATQWVADGADAAARSGRSATAFAELDYVVSRR
jgi:hypothetical protein